MITLSEIRHATKINNDRTAFLKWANSHYKETIPNLSHNLVLNELTQRHNELAKKMPGLSNFEGVEEKFLLNAEAMLMKNKKLLMAEFEKQIEKFKKKERAKIIVVSKKSNPSKTKANEVEDQAENEEPTCETTANKKIE